MLALRSSQLSNLGLAGWTAESGISLPWRSGIFEVHRMLGWKPILPGFAVNAAVFAIVWWLIFAAGALTLARRRIKRGLCRRCAYPVTGLAVCPECGLTAPRARP